MTLLVFALMLALVLGVIAAGLVGPPADPFQDPRTLLRSSGADVAAAPLNAPAEAAGSDTPDTGLELAEAALAARLLSGELPAVDYQQEMARLAAAAAGGRPTVVPREPGL
jgi:hypothetical protein